MRPPAKIDRYEIMFARAISPAVRSKILAEPESNCGMCGLTSGETDWTTGQTARLYVNLTVPNGATKADQHTYSVMCSICKEGRKHLTSETPTSEWLIARIEEAALPVQRALFDRIASSPSSRI